MATNHVKHAGRSRHLANKRHQQKPDGDVRTKPKPEDKITAPMKPPSSKAAQFAEYAEADGRWTVEKIRRDGRKTVRATRGDEVIEAHWDSANGNWIPEGTYHGHGRQRLLKNSSDARQLITRPADEAEAANAEKVRAAPRSRGEMLLARAYIPFDLADNDKTILAMVAGRAVTWRNGIAGDSMETATVPHAGKTTELRHDKSGDPARRTLLFCDPHVGGFRAVRLCDIVSVG